MGAIESGAEATASTEAGTVAATAALLREVGSPLQLEEVQVCAPGLPRNAA